MFLKQHNTPNLPNITKTQTTHNLNSLIISYFSNYTALLYLDYIPYEEECIFKLALNNKVVYLVPPTSITNVYKYELYDNGDKLLAGIFQLEELNNILNWLMKI